MKLRTQRRAGERDEDNPYWISFSDLTSALLLVFLLAVVVLILQLQEQRQNLAEVQEEASSELSALQGEIAALNARELSRAELVRNLGAALREASIEVIIDEKNGVIRIPAEVIGFASGSADVTDRGRAALIGQILWEGLTADNYTEILDTVFVEGHTDIDPLNLPGGNWALSADRAINMWQVWEADLPAGGRLGTLVNGTGQPLFSVSGYAETRPVVTPQVTEEDKRPNRRIDIRFTLAAPTSEEAGEILDRFDEPAEGP